MFYISQTTRNNLICTDMQEAIINLILNKQAAASVLMCMVNCLPSLHGGRDRRLSSSCSWNPADAPGRAGQATKAPVLQEPGLCHSQFVLLHSPTLRLLLA